MPSSRSEIKAGAFVAFAVALLFVMVFAVGDCGHLFRGRHEREVLFQHVSGLKPNSAVNYAGVEVGRVRETRIVKVNREVLAKLPTLTLESLDRLPLSYEEVAGLKALADPENPKRLDAAAREKIAGRKMIVLVLEINRSPQELAFRADDLVRLETTLMGDSAVEISPGSGRAVPPEQVLLGDGSNLFTQLSASMREIRRLLGQVSGLVGEEERVNIKAMLANLKKASEDISLASAEARKIVSETKEPIKSAAEDLRAGMREARTAVAEVRKTVTEVKPKVIAALEGGKKMMESGREAAESADRLMRQARPKVVKLLEESAGAAKSAQGALGELETLLSETGNTMDENRPAMRRALADLRESARNMKEMSARLKRQPWLLFKKPKGTQDVILLEAAARSLSEATENLTSSMECLNKITADPERAARLGEEETGDLIKEIRSIQMDLEGRKKEVEVKLKELERKKGGGYLKRAREKADREL